MVQLLRDTPLDRVYTWGLDMSGLGDVGPASSRSADGIHGAGGIGGLLALDTTVSTECSGRWPAGSARSSRQGLAAQNSRSGSAKNYWFLYDANGNVGQVLDATDLSAITTAAKYEDDPYGNTLAATGTYAAANPFRFSTKWFDTETGLCYYGYRYYNAKLGRWMSRDPMEEIIGSLAEHSRSSLGYQDLNLYGFTRNNATCHTDYLGLQVPKPVPLPIPNPYPIIPEGFGCTVERVGTRCITCCTTLVSGALVILCNPTSCGATDMITWEVPLPVPDPYAPCPDGTTQTCRNKCPGREITRVDRVRLKKPEDPWVRPWHRPCLGDHYHYHDWDQKPYPYCTCHRRGEDAGCLDQGANPPNQGAHPAD